MKIVIVGLGTIGGDVLKILAKDNHQITVVDENKTLVESLIEKYDIQGVVGNGASLDIQIEAGMKNADVAIVLTQSDEMNIFACLVAKKLGVQNTVARVRNPDYRQQIGVMREELGISMVVNPEQDTANEIFNLISLPAVVDLERFANGKVLLAQVAVTSDSSLVGKNLITIGQTFQTKVLVCAVHRGDEVIIPAGRFVIEVGDKICFTANSKDLRDFLSEANIIKNPLRNIMIVGGSQIAYYLASQLSQKKYKVKLVEENLGVAESLADKLPKVTIVNGSGLRHDVLIEEGIEDMDVFAALTGDDEDNLIISMFANSKGIKKTITQVQNDDLLGMVGSMGLENNVSSKDVVTDNIASYIRALENSKGSNVQALYRLVNGKVEALEFIAKKNDSFYGKALKDLTVKKNCLVAAIIRNNRVFIPNGTSTIELGDRVVVVTTYTDFDDLSDIFE